MPKWTVLAVVTALAGCALPSPSSSPGVQGPAPSTSRGAPADSPAPSPGLLVVPVLTGLTAAQAEAALRAAGFTFDRLAITDYACDQVDESKMVAPDTVCDQHPAAGQERAPRLIAVSITIEPLPPTACCAFWIKLVHTWFSSST